MTGTGSTVFGIFNKNEEISERAEKEYFQKWIHTLLF
jgi:4-diphosphocytidyl-2C-methyl-D-erythritol kinase